MSTSVFTGTREAEDAQEVTGAEAGRQETWCGVVW